jgi:hypothetical protein
VDGFNLAYAVTPDSFADFIDLVVSELQRRGRYKTRPARCAKSSTVQVVRSSAGIIQRQGSAAQPIDLAANERVRRGPATLRLRPGATLPRPPGQTSYPCKRAAFAVRHVTAASPRTADAIQLFCRHGEGRPRVRVRLPPAKSLQTSLRASLSKKRRQAPRLAPMHSPPRPVAGYCGAAHAVSASERAAAYCGRSIKLRRQSAWRRLTSARPAAPSLSSDRACRSLR